MWDQIEQWLNRNELLEEMTVLVNRGGAFLGVLLLALVVYGIARRFLIPFLEKLARKSKSDWDDIILQHNVVVRLAHLAPALFIYLLSPVVFAGYEMAIRVVQRVMLLYILIVAFLVVDAALNAFVTIYNSFSVSRRLPIRGFIQIVKLLFFLVIGILALSLVLGKSPAVFLGGLGAMTAVLLLIFRDSILGFVAGVQLASNQMVRIGDWIEMPKFGADGDVIDVSLMTVKVQNWDKTISMIPTYALVSDSFKNWRGMQESGGRRIKRAIYIDMNSIQLCTPEMIERYRKIQVLRDYIDQKQKELRQYNEKHEIDNSVLVNGRRMTNVGTFRAYLVNYLKRHPQVHQDMTFLVRQLAPTEHGLPIEIYIFSKDTVWANYEAIQADIFDHVLSVVPEFDLRVFQRPSGLDFQQVLSGGKED